MSFLYWTASFFNPKAKLFVRGREKQRKEFVEVFKDRPAHIIWIHAASLGEFEQGRPVIESLKDQLPDYKILLTFFSPSGYEVRKNYPHADWVFYLPWDTKKNAEKWVQKVNPSLAIFIKYEFWLNYSHELAKKKIPLISISSIFRENQLFFKTYGGFYRAILANFSHFFVQNTISKELLKSIGTTNVTITGDTRLDRVYEVSKNPREIGQASAFKGSQKVMVVGSCWEEDFNVLAPFINEQKDQLKFIIAPHELTENFFKQIEDSISGKVIRFSNVTNAIELEPYQVLIIDNIGMLSQLYQYGEFAYIGGGFGKGIHNILEAAAFGVPIFFGNKNYSRFQEANNLIAQGGAFGIGSYTELRKEYEHLILFPESFLLACEVNRQYVADNIGATEKIVNYCKKMLL
jgi:3-deoxy-D-manno-octulosonic-acid transferase